MTFKSLRSIDSHGQKSRTDWLSELEQNIFKWPLEKVRSSTTNWLIFQWKNIRGLDTHSWSYTQIGRSIPRGKKQREGEILDPVKLLWDGLLFLCLDMCTHGEKKLSAADAGISRIESPHHWISCFPIKANVISYQAGQRIDPNRGQMLKKKMGLLDFIFFERIIKLTRDKWWSINCRKCGRMAFIVGVF